MLLGPFAGAAILNNGKKRMPVSSFERTERIPVQPFLTNRDGRYRHMRVG